MPQLFRHPRSVLKIFLVFLSGFTVIFKNKKKVIALTEASFSPIFYVDLQKKAGPSSEFCKFSTRFVLHTTTSRREPLLFSVYCLRFLAGNKNAGSWREKKRRNSQKFSSKMPEKNSHFFAISRRDTLAIGYRRYN